MSYSVSIPPCIHLTLTLTCLVISSSGVVLEGLSLARRAPADSTSPLPAPVSGGSVPFQAPEVIFNTGLSTASDIWSVGALAFVLLTGELAFPETHAVRLKVSIKKAAFSVPDYVSPAAKEMLIAMMNPDASARPSAKQVLAMSFFSSPSDAPIANFADRVARLAVQ